MNLLQDDTGATSSMRVAFLAVVLTACVCAIAATVGYFFLGKGDSGAIAGISALVATLLTPAFAGKVGQSFSERKDE